MYTRIRGETAGICGGLGFKSQSCILLLTKLRNIY